MISPFNDDKTHFSGVLRSVTRGSALQLRSFGTSRVEPRSLALPLVHSAPAQWPLFKLGSGVGSEVQEAFGTFE